MTGSNPSRDEIVRGLIEIGERGIAVEDEAALNAYFGDGFVFHGPGGSETDFEGLKGYFSAMRRAFGDFSVTRGHVLVDGRWVAAQTRMAGVLAGKGPRSPDQKVEHYLPLSVRLHPGRVGRCCCPL